MMFCFCICWKLLFAHNYMTARSQALRHRSMPSSRVLQPVVGLLQSLWWDKFHIPFSYWLELFSKSRGPPGSCVKWGVLWKWFLSGAQEAFASEDQSAGSGTAFMNISQPAYVCVYLCERWGHSLVVWYEPCSENVYLLVKEKKWWEPFLWPRSFSVSSPSVSNCYCFISNTNELLRNVQHVWRSSSSASGVQAETQGKNLQVLCMYLYDVLIK